MSPHEEPPGIVCLCCTQQLRGLRAAAQESALGSPHGPIFSVGKRELFELHPPNAHAIPVVSGVLLITSDTTEPARRPSPNASAWRSLLMHRICRVKLTHRPGGVSVVILLRACNQQPPQFFTGKRKSISLHFYSTSGCSAHTTFLQPP